VGAWNKEQNHVTPPSAEVDEKSGRSISRWNRILHLGRFCQTVSSKCLLEPIFR
jgi:hypothetical protein